MSDIKTRVLVSSPQIRRILLARGREASRYRGGLIALLAERTQIPNLAELPTGELVGKMLFLEETTEPLGGIIQGIIAPTPIEEPESHKVARCIMGHHFLGMPEVGKVFGGLSAEAQTALAAIPFSETTLQNRRDTHVLVADLGLSIIDVRGRELLGFYADACYNAQEFATRTSQVSWRLIRKTPIPSSTSKSWIKQLALIEAGDNVSTARELVYMIVLVFATTGECLFETIVRTSDLDLRGYHIQVAFVKECGLGFYGWYDDGPSDSVGLSSSQKAA